MFRKKKHKNKRSKLGCSATPQSSKKSGKKNKRFGIDVQKFSEICNSIPLNKHKVEIIFSVE